MFTRLILSALTLILCLSAQAPGSYSGTWSSGSSGSSGKLTLVFGEKGLSASSFTIQGQEVKTKPISSKANGDLVEFTFEYDIDGNLLRSRMEGTIDGHSLKGKYQSSPAGGGSPVDEGTWEVKQQ